MSNQADKDDTNNPPPKRPYIGIGTENDVFTTTKVDNDTFSVTWKIQNFQASLESKRDIESAILCGGPKTKKSWQAKFTPKMFDYTNQECSQFRLDICAPEASTQSWTEFLFGNAPIQARVDVSIFDEKNNLLSQTSKNQPIMNYPYGMAWKCLFGQNKRASIVDIYIIMKFEIMLPPKNTVSSLIGKEPPKFSLNWASMWKQSLLTDLNILSKQGTAFRVHKAFIGAHSPTFLAIFTSKKDLKSVTINFEDETIKAMLDYLYTGKLNCGQNLVMDLIQLSGIHDVPRLKAKCEPLVELCIENAVDILIFADKHNADYLKARVIKFFHENQDAIKETWSYKHILQNGVHGKLMYDLYFSQ